MKFFNTAGPVNCADHYCIPPLTRLNLEDVLMLIAQKKYFVLHAPRQTGKTSCLLALMDYLNASGKYKCLYVNVEIAQSAREDVETGMKAILNQMAGSAEDFLNDFLIQQTWTDILARSGGNAALGEVLRRWCFENNKPTIVLIDEIDSLVGDTLISVLRQLRAGYVSRPASFPQSVILCGVRDVRDYRIHSSSDKAIITGGSAFNIKAESLRLGDFSKQDVETLFRCHTDETGQAFDPEAIELVWQYSEGQPWIVNALGYEVCFNMKANRDRNKPILPESVLQAKENLILRRETHIDQLADKLREERVRRIIEPVLAGLAAPENLPGDDLMYVRDLGLIKTDGNIRIANRLYQEVIPRELTWPTQVTITHETGWYVRADGRLDMTGLLTAFQDFFRKHSEHWVERFEYKEAGPQLLLQAFLQRILNSGGRVEREYGLGRMRTDLLVVWKFAGGVQQIVIELKIRYESLETTIREGLSQTAAYMDKCGTDEGHLVIFDRQKGTSWDEKIFRKAETYQGKAITVWGM